MKLVLRKTVRDVGQAGTIITVTDAYARNFLFPQGLAEPATAAVVAAAKKDAAGRAAAQQRQQAAAMVARQRLVDARLELRGRGQPNGRLYQALHQAEVIRALERRYGVSLAGVTIAPTNLKKTGDESVTLTWPDHATVSVTVSVVAEGETTRR
jgi:large subunit ribosomal protein L9